MMLYGLVSGPCDEVWLHDACLPSWRGKPGFCLAVQAGDWERYRIGPGLWKVPIREIRQRLIFVSWDDDRGKVQIRRVGQVVPEEMVKLLALEGPHMIHS